MVNPLDCLDTQCFVSDTVDVTNISPDEIWHMFLGTNPDNKDKKFPEVFIVTIDSITKQGFVHTTFEADFSSEDFVEESKIYRYAIPCNSFTLTGK